MAPIEEFFRALEQIRNDICFHNLNVKIVTVGSGFAYAAAGYTHYGIEDIAIIRTLPNISIFCPADPIQLNIIFLLMVLTITLCLPTLRSINYIKKI